MLCSKDQRSDDWRKIIFGVTALCLLAHAPSVWAMFNGMWPFGGDAISAFAPWREWARGQLQEGVLPLWNPHTFCGVPFMSNGQSAVLYPPNLIYWLLPTRAAMPLDVIAHTIFLGCGAYFLARVLGLCHASCWLVAICVALGSAVAARTSAGHLTWHAARAYLPWQLGTLLLYLRAGNPRHVWVLVVLFAAQIFSGHPLITLLSVAWCGGALMVWMLLSRPLPRATIPILGLGSLLLCALASAQVLPLRETARLTAHGTGLPFEHAIIPSSTWAGWVRLALPDFFGGNRAAQWSIDEYPFEEAAYIGLLPLVLVLLAPFLIRDRNRSTRAAVWVLWCVLPAMMILALGEHTPLYRFLFDLLPPLRVVRAPARWLEVWYFAAALLAGLTFDACLRARDNMSDTRSTNAAPFGRVITSLQALSVSCFAVMLCVMLAPPQSALWMNWAQWNKTDVVAPLAARLQYAEYLRLNALQSVGIAIVIARINIILLRRFQNGAMNSRVRLPIFLLVLVALDLLRVFWSSAEVISVGDSRATWPPAAQRFYQTGQRWDTALQGEAFNYNLNQNLPLEIDLFGGYDPMSPAPFLEYVSAMEGRKLWSSQYQTQDAAVRSPLLRVAGVTHILSSVPHPQWSHKQIVAHIGRGESERILWRRSGAWPRAYLTRRVLRAPLKEQLALLRRAAAPNSSNLDLPVIAAPLVFHGVSPSPLTGSEKILRSQRTTNVMTLESSTRAPAILVVSEALFPGWHAWVNGKPTRIERANFLFRAVKVPAGISRVVMVYDNQAFRCGVFLTLCGLMLLSAMAVQKAIANRQAHRGASAITD